MKKNKILLLMLLMFVFSFWVLLASSQISQTELDTQIKAGNVLSDWYTSFSECNNLKDKYNNEYTNYKRSECFLNGNTYNYFICPSSSMCNVDLTISSPTPIENIPNKDKLDLFLSKISAMKKELNDDDKYKSILSQVNLQLENLWNKYKSNTTISQMLVYLRSGIESIKKDLDTNKDVDNFLCELLGNCWVKNKCPQISAPFCQNGSPISKWTYIDNDGCERIKYECPVSLSCTQQYDPVCAQPPMPVCNNPNISCIQVMPQPKTYGNSCMAWLEKASILYKWECNTQDISPQSAIFEHKATLTQETKTSYYLDEKVDLYSKNLWKNVVWCMEQVWVPSTSCSIQSNWIPLPKPWYYTGSDWKHDALIMGKAGTYIWYHKDRDTGKEVKIQFTILNQKRPPYLKYSNIIYNWEKALDVYRPSDISESQKIPVILWVHGWWWMEWTDKNSDVMVEFSKYFHQNGMAYVSMNYTLSSSTRTGTYTKIYKELDCALQWVHANKDKYNFDVNNISLVGWSAWAHVILQYALNQSEYKDTTCPWNISLPKFQKVSPIATPTNLNANLTNTSMGDITYMVEQLLWAKRWTQEFIQRATQNSPINFVNKDNKNIKYYMLHGLQDYMVTYKDHAEPMYNALKNSGYNVIMDTKMDGHDWLSIKSPEWIQFLKN